MSRASLKHALQAEFAIQLFLTRKVRVNTTGAPHRLRKLLRFSERVEAPRVAVFDCSVRIVVLVIDTEVLALLLDTYTPFEVPAHAFHFCPSTKSRLHDAPLIGWHG
jgi:hypothetical protein